MTGMLPFGFEDLPLISLINFPFPPFLVINTSSFLERTGGHIATCINRKDISNLLNANIRSKDPYNSFFFLK